MCWILRYKMASKIGPKCSFKIQTKQEFLNWLKNGCITLFKSLDWAVISIQLHLSILIKSTFLWPYLDLSSRTRFFRNSVGSSFAKEVKVVCVYHCVSKAIRISVFLGRANFNYRVSQQISLHQFQRCLYDLIVAAKLVIGRYQFSLALFSLLALRNNPRIDETRPRMDEKYTENWETKKGYVAMFSYTMFRSIFGPF